MPARRSTPAPRRKMPTGTTRRPARSRSSGRRSMLTVEPSIYVQTLHINDTGAYWVSMSNPSDNTYYNGNAQRDPSTDPWYLGAIKVDWTSPRSRGLEHLVFLAQSAFHLGLHPVAQYGVLRRPVRGSQRQYQRERIRLLQRQPEQFHAGDPCQLRRSAGPAHLERGRLLFARAREHDRIHLRSELGNEYGYSLRCRATLSTVSRYSACSTSNTPVFGEANFKITDHLNFTAGLRYSHIDYTNVAKESGTILGRKASTARPRAATSRSRRASC